MAIEIPLVNGRGSALIDDEDAELVAGRRWYLSGTGYAAAVVRGTPRTLIYMHRLLLDPPVGVQVDHINRVKLDNRRTNLRVATRRENQANISLRADNTSGFRGVTWDAQHHRWRAQVGRRRRRYLGVYDTAEEAARAYDRAALAEFGAFAFLNYPSEEQAEC